MDTNNIRDVDELDARYERLMQRTKTLKYEAALIGCCSLIGVVVILVLLQVLS